MAITGQKMAGQKKKYKNEKRERKKRGNESETKGSMTNKRLYEWIRGVTPIVSEDWGEVTKKDHR